MAARIRVLFICLGNICRSPVAAAVLQHRLREVGADPFVEVSSAGLGGWHAGERPDERAREVAARHGIPMVSRARQVEPDEFARTHLIICMDEQNRRGLARMGAPAERVQLLKSFSATPIGATMEVDDPYPHGPEAFDLMFKEIMIAVDALVEHLVREHELPCRANAGAKRANRAEGKDDGD
ncbi:MAG: low molecular weight phosphotyrosine protein phosphatase [Phycisphaeraceae bacterium]|nr:low molecular weight phosphotyrosine protein phosphatase [Phycisphaeraceae bacterium]